MTISILKTFRGLVAYTKILFVQKRLQKTICFKNVWNCWTIIQNAQRNLTHFTQVTRNMDYFLLFFGGKYVKSSRQKLFLNKFRKSHLRSSQQTLQDVMPTKLNSNLSWKKHLLHACRSPCCLVWSAGETGSLELVLDCSILAEAGDSVGRRHGRSGEGSRLAGCGEPATVFKLSNKTKKLINGAGSRDFWHRLFVRNKQVYTP